MSNETNVRRSGVFTIAFATIGVMTLLFLSLFFVLIAFTVHSVSDSFKTMLSASSPHKSTGSKINYAVPHQRAPYIAGIKLSGEINDATADEVIDKLQTAKEDSAVVGVLFEVNSPGGSVVPSQEIYDEVKQVRAVKPVVVYVREMAASGAYYSSASATKIIANRGSLIGSIGVIMQGLEADKLIQFLKINPVTIKTGSLKDTGSPMRPMTDNDKKYLQELINATRSEFALDVKNGRGASEQTMSFMSDGRVVLAPQALELKLIDNIGSKDFALEEIAKLAKQKKVPELFYYENIDSFSNIFSQKFSSQANDIIKNSVSEILSSSHSMQLLK